MPDWPTPITLSGTHARLEPLSPSHHDDLAEATTAGQLHTLWYTTVPDAVGMRAEIDRRLALQDAGTMLPFAAIDPATGRAVGMTTYMNIEAAHKRVEIGSTWYSPAVQRTKLNTECKLMLLRHAFEGLDCNCVEFRTHVINTQSRRAIERLGAHFDGVLRANMIMANGTVRDTAVYSIIAGEWPTVRAHLEHKLSQ